MKEPSLRQVEKKTYMSYHQDGLIDIFVGVYVLLFGSGILLATLVGFSTWIVIPAIFPAVILPIWVSAKKQITMPRIGYVKFRSRGASRLMAVLLGIMVALLGAFMALAFASKDQAWALTLRNLIIPNSLIIIGVGAALVSSLFAYTMGLKRLHAYGLLTLVLFLIGHYIAIPLAYLLVIIASAIIVNGAVLLTRFIQKYPKAQGDKTDAEETI